ncbi:MAG: hypothetical protein ACYSTY_10455 [Planctomycetota bacterium]|jgi:hypothetical protein
MAYLLAEYVTLLETLRSRGYAMEPVRAYYGRPEPPVIFLRHDVDRLVARAVSMARAEHELGVSSTYYFRCNAGGRFPATAVGEVAALGHEVGYHYETVSRERGDVQKAFNRFVQELGALRKIVSVVTVAAHGSPFSSHSNMEYVRTLDLSELDLLGEPAVDFDFLRVLYVTDTGGTFGNTHNVRDRVTGRNLDRAATPAQLGRMLAPESEPLVLLNCHPERWPRRRFGLVQAQATDLGVNLAKRAARRC